MFANSCSSAHLHLPPRCPATSLEEALLTGPLEPTNEPYAIAKIAGIKICESYNRQYGTDYRCVMPANLYGPNDSYHSENSHVLPALMARFHEAVRDGAEEVVIWGTGTPAREFLHVDDMADACLFVLNLPESTYRENTRPMLSHVNVGSGEDVSIAELARSLAKVTGFSGRISYDRSRPDGTPRKLLDVSRLAAMDGVRRSHWNRESAGPTSGSFKTRARRAANQCPNLSSPAATGFPRWALPCSRSGAARRRLMCGERGQRSRVLHRFHRSKVSSDSMRVA